MTPWPPCWTAPRSRWSSHRSSSRNSTTSWRLGVDAEIATFRELSGGAWDLAAFDTDDLTELVPIIEKYHDQQIGVADASNVLLAARHDTRTIATLDRRHFSVLRPLAGGRFTVVP